MGISLPTQHMVARALGSASCYDPRGSSAGFRGQPPAGKYNQAPGFVLQGEPRGQAQSLGEVVVSAELLA